jgi:hypothetical protein
MAKLPSLTLAGKLRYATAPAFLGAGGGLVGAAVGHDAASEKSKKKGRARDQAVRRGTLAGGLVGAGALFGGGMLAGRASKRPEMKKVAGLPRAVL